MADLGLPAAERARLMACPACDVAPLATGQAAQALPRSDVILSLPSAHCATCISDVERALATHPGVRAARVNLTLRRVSVDAPGLTAAELIPVLDAIGYEAHELDPGALASSEADRQAREILMRIGVAGFAMMNIMILSVAVWSGAEGGTRALFHWLSAAIALPTIAFAGQPFFASAWRSLRARRLGMDVPISLALILASAISLSETFAGGHTAWFDAATMLCFFLLVGRYLDFRTRAIARSAAAELTALEVPRAILVDADGTERQAPVAEIAAGMHVRVRPGGRVPVDGVIEDGASEIDRALLTGESLPVAAAPGSAVSAGEVNLTGPLLVRVTAAGRDTTLSRLAALVAHAESARTRYTSLAERAARVYSPFVHALAFLTFCGWLAATGDARLGVNIAAAVLIITCPCALGLAVPAVVTAASGRLYRRGLLIKDGTALERLAEARVAVFDKTGTLTLGRPEWTNPDALPEAARPLAKALAAGSSHPLAQALAAGIAEAAAEVEDWREVPGHGVEAFARGRRLRLGRAAWLGAEDAGTAQASWLSLGDGTAPIRLAFADSLRPGAAEAVAGLRDAGLRVVLLSGDAEGPVADIAARLGITAWRAGVSPEGKAEAIAALRAESGPVLMIGDGLNDTAALAAADVSISPASALDAARAASDVVLTARDLAPVAEALRVARAARARIRENFAISAAYNVVAVPIAIAGFATPLMAALAMSASSITVTLNALRLPR